MVTRRTTFFFVIELVNLLIYVFIVLSSVLDNNLKYMKIQHVFESIGQIYLFINIHIQIFRFLIFNTIFFL